MEKNKQTENDWKSLEISPSMTSAAKVGLQVAGGPEHRLQIRKTLYFEENFLIYRWGKFSFMHCAESQTPRVCFQGARVVRLQ